MGRTRAWVEVDAAALGRNALRLSELLAPTRMLPMVKADGYGLGAVRVVRALRKAGPWGFGVATAEEGAALRRAGIDARVVVFTPAPGSADRLLKERLEPAVTGSEALRRWTEVARGREEPVPVHLEVDTGMSRAGLRAEEVATWLPRLRRAVEGGLRLESTFTHFHSAGTDAAATRRQWGRFGQVLEALRAAGLDPGLVHAANSAAVLAHPEMRADLARPGLYLYGGSVGAPDPEPVVAVRARVLELREVPAGTSVGYGATWRAPRRARLATLGIGYGDGLRHGLSNRGRVLLGGRRVPIVGSVCMDVTVVDVTDAGNVEVGEVATLLGRDGDEEITLLELARASQTIEYEVLTGLAPRLPRR